jgi:hypothetical protein
VRPAPIRDGDVLATGGPEVGVSDSNATGSRKNALKNPIIAAKRIATSGNAAR